MGWVADKISQFIKPKPIEGKSPDTAEIGYADSILYGSNDFIKFNPDALIISKGYKVYRYMMLDDQVKAVTEFKRAAVISRGYYFDVESDPDTGEPIEEQEEIGRFFDFVVDKIKGSFTDKLLGILSALPSGFSITEKVYQPIEYDGKSYWGIKDLKLRPFETFNGGFTVDNHGNILKLEQVACGNTNTIPMEKVVHFVHQPDIDPHYGESDLRAAYRAWWSKDIAIKFQNIHLERHAGGFIHATVKGNLNPTQTTNLENLLKNVSARTGAMVPEAVTLGQFNPMRTDAYDRAISQHDKSIAKSILVPNLLGLSEQGNTGSYSQSQTQLTAFFWILDMIANRLAETLNEQLFLQLSLWNFGTDVFPRFTFEPISESQKEVIAKVWSEMVSKGSVTKSDSDEDWLRRLIGAPEKSEVEEIEPELPVQPVDEPIEIPDNEDWVESKPEEQQELIRKEFSEKPWLKRVNFARLEKAWNKKDSDFLNGMIETMVELSQNIQNQIKKLFGVRSGANINLTELKNIIPPKAINGRLRKTIKDSLQDITDINYKMAMKEVPKQKKRNFRVGDPRIGMDKTKIEKSLSSKALKIADTIFYRTFDGVQRALENAIKYDKTLKQTMDSLWNDTDLSTYLPQVDAAGRAVNIPARLENIARTNTASAVNDARQALFGNDEFKGFITAYEYSAILDDRVTPICEELHGKIMKDFSNYTPPNHFQCRSILIPVTVVDDWDGKESSKPRLEPNKGFF